MKTQTQVLKETVQKFPTDVALEYFDTSITYFTLYKYVNSIAAQLSSYVRKGDVVALSMQNIPQFVILEYAIWKLGAIVLPLNPMYTPREIEYYLDDANVKLVVSMCETYEALKTAAKGKSVSVMKTNSNSLGKIPDYLATKWGVIDCNDDLEFQTDSEERCKDATLSPDDTAMIVYTSGTTGDPKGAVISHRNLYSSSSIYKRWFRFSKEDKILGIAPFFHITGLVFHIATAILSGASIAVSYRFDPEFALKTVERKRTTVTMAAATAYLAMLNVPGIERIDLSSMRMWSSGGMPVPKALEERWKKITGQWIYVAWGLTETTSPATVWPYPYDGEMPYDEESKVVSSGVPVTNTRVKIVDGSQVGEIAVKGPQVIKEYLNKPEATAKTIVDGWLLTGDVAKIKDDFVFIIDRKKDIIDASGFKVWPREVEEVMYDHPAVLEAAVVGVPDEYRGETVKAYIRLKDGFSAEEETKRSIIEFARKRLAAYKVPRIIEFVPEIKKTASGKIMRRAFKEDY
ncbi:MAG: AMP-binding protein [Conexivisphaerales archaeon]